MIRGSLTWRLGWSVEQLVRQSAANRTAAAFIVPRNGRNGLLTHVRFTFCSLLCARTLPHGQVTLFDDLLFLPTTRLELPFEKIDRGVRASVGRLAGLSICSRGRDYPGQLCLHLADRFGLAPHLQHVDGEAQPE